LWVLNTTEGGADEGIIDELKTGVIRSRGQDAGIRVNGRKVKGQLMMPMSLPRL